MGHYLDLGDFNHSLVLRLQVLMPKTHKENNKQLPISKLMIAGYVQFILKIVLMI